MPGYQPNHVFLLSFVNVAFSGHTRLLFISESLYFKVAFPLSIDGKTEHHPRCVHLYIASSYSISTNCYLQECLMGDCSKR